MSKAREFQDARSHVILVYPGPSEGLKQRAGEFIRGKTLPENFQILLDPDFTFTKSYGLRWDAPKETAYPSAFVIDSTRHDPVREDQPLTRRPCQSGRDPRGAQEVSRAALGEPKPAAAEPSPTDRIRRRVPGRAAHHRQSTPPAGAGGHQPPGPGSSPEVDGHRARSGVRITAPWVASDGAVARDRHHRDSNEFGPTGGRARSRGSVVHASADGSSWDW